MSDRIEGAPVAKRRHPKQDPRWAKRWRLDNARGIRRYIDAGPARAHIRDLRAKGASLRGVADAAGLSPHVICKVADDQRLIRRVSEARILKVTPTDILDRAGAEDFVPKIGAVRRLEALAVIGHNPDTIAQAMGAGATAGIVRNIRNHPGEWISRQNFDRAAAAYDALWSTPGTSNQTRSAARKRGFASPLAWDDDTIDDPAFQSVADAVGGDDEVDQIAVDMVLGGYHLDLGKPEQDAVIRRLTENGQSARQIAHRLGIAERTVTRSRSQQTPKRQTRPA